MQVSEFRYRRLVQFAETDLAGVVHFSCFFRYMEEAEHALWRAAGLSIAPPGSDLGFPRVSASLDFQAPLHFEDEVEVWIRIASISRRTIRYVSTLTCGFTVATGTVTAACVRKSPPPMRATDIPELIRARLAVHSSAGPEPVDSKPGSRDPRVEAICARIAAGENFWTAVGDPYLARNLSRSEAQEVIRQGLLDASNSYSLLLSRFNLPRGDYQRFMDFLRHHRLKPDVR
jgi:YbgC/YbaW family acyl-CoA thioester hydrolase